VKSEMLQPTINKRLLANHSHLSRTEKMHQSSVRCTRHF